MYKYILFKESKRKKRVTQQSPAENSIQRLSTRKPHLFGIDQDVIWPLEPHWRVCRNAPRHTRSDDRSYSQRQQGDGDRNGTAFDRHSEEQVALGGDPVPAARSSGVRL